MKKNNIIIFGATGTLGLYLIDYLSEHLNDGSWHFVAVGRRKTQYFNKYSPLVSYVNADISDFQSLRKLPTSNIKAVIHMAGALPGYMKGYNPRAYIDSNVTGTFNVLEYSKEVGADRILYTQTISDYYGYYGKIQRFMEDMPRNIPYAGDHSMYAISKCMAEDMCWHYKASYGLKSFVFRLPNIYCYMPDEKILYADGKPARSSYRCMIRLAMEGKPIEMWGDPQKGIDAIYVKDFCQMINKAIFVNRDGGKYNAGTGVMTSMQHQIEGIIKVFCESGNVSQIIPRPEKHSCVNFCMDISKAQEELGYLPEYDYIKYLQDYKKEMKSNRFLDFFND